MEYIIIFLVGFIIGQLLPVKSSYFKILTPQKIKKDHLKPVYYGYNGGYAEVNKCPCCFLIGLYEDLHQANPCPRCGHKVQLYGAAKWMLKNGVKMWVLSENDKKK